MAAIMGLMPSAGGSFYSAQHEESQLDLKLSAGNMKEQSLAIRRPSEK
jgi:hypothetical protein